MVTTVRRGRGRPPRSEDSRQDEILRAALRAFAQGGYEGTNLRRIAADADVDVALIAHHFGSKLELWKAVVDGLAVRRMTAAEGGARFVRRADIADRVRLALRRYIHINSDMPELGMLVSQEMQLIRRAPRLSVRAPHQTLLRSAGASHPGSHRGRCHPTAGSGHSFLPSCDVGLHVDGDPAADRTVHGGRRQRGSLPGCPGTERHGKRVGS